MHPLSALLVPSTPLRGTTGMTTSATALVGAEADRTQAPVTVLGSGRFAFPIVPRKSKLITLVADAAGAVVDCRVKLWRKVLDGMTSGYNPMHAFDVRWTSATAATGVANGPVGAALFYGTTAIVSAYSLPTAAVTIFGAGLADSAQPVLFDPLDVEFCTVDVKSPGARIAILAADLNPN